MYTTGRMKKLKDENRYELLNEGKFSLLTFKY